MASTVSQTEQGSHGILKVAEKKFLHFSARMFRKVDCGFFVFWVDEQNVVKTLTRKDLQELHHAQELAFIRAKTLYRIENIVMQSCNCVTRKPLAETHLYIE